VWRVLIQLPSLISELIGHLRTISYLTQQSLLLQQETNGLLRELMIKVTTQPAETPHAVVLPIPQETSSPTLAPPPLMSRRGPSTDDGQKRRILTEHDISRQTRSTMAQEQFRTEGVKQYPHRQGESLPTSPNQAPGPATRPLGGPPQ